MICSKAEWMNFQVSSVISLDRSKCWTIDARIFMQVCKANPISDRFWLVFKKSKYFANMSFSGLKSPIATHIELIDLKILLTVVLFEIPTIQSDKEFKILQGDILSLIAICPETRLIVLQMLWSHPIDIFDYGGVLIKRFCLLYLQEFQR